MDKVRVIIADDHAIFRIGLRQVIEHNPSFLVAAEAGDGEEALAQIENLQPHIAILDLDMPKLDGFGVARELEKRRSPALIVFLTLHAQADLCHAAMDLGARGYILKDSATLEVEQGLLAVSAGKYYVSSALTIHLLNRHRPPAAVIDEGSSLKILTESERRILRLIAQDKSSKEIADQLCVHYRTIENRRTVICQKLGLHGNYALLKYALENKAKL